jgi:hypothetical protein
MDHRIARAAETVWGPSLEVIDSVLWHSTNPTAMAADLQHLVRQTRCIGLMAVLLTTLIVMGIVSAGSASTVEWEKSYAHYNKTGAYDIVQTDDGGFIIVGETLHPREEGDFASSAFSQAYIVRVDGRGNLVWERTFDDNMTRSLQSIIKTRGGNYAVAGTASAPPTHVADAYLAAMDSSGSILWERTFGGDFYYDAAFDLIEVKSGGFIVVGAATNSTPGYDTGISLIRTDNSGDIVWERTYGSSTYDLGQSVRATPDGGYVVAGFGQTGLLKTDGNGTMLWSVSFLEPPATGMDRMTVPNAVRVVSEGEYLVAGWTLSRTGFEYALSACLMKIDQDGGILWSKEYPGNGSSGFYSAELTDDGSIVAVGFTGEPIPAGQAAMSGESRIYLVRTDCDGNMLWETSLGQDWDGIGRSVQLLDDGGIVIAGSVASLKEGAREGYPDSYLSRAYIAKFSSDGGRASAEGVSTPLLYAPVLAVPLYLLYRWRRAP